MMCDGVQADAPLYEAVLPDHHTTPVRLPRRSPKNRPKRQKSSLKLSCDCSPIHEACAEIQSVPCPASAAAVRTDPSQHLHEHKSEPLDAPQNGSDVCEPKGKRFSSSSLTESDADLQVKSGLFPVLDDPFDFNREKQENQSRLFAQTAHRIRMGIQLYLEVLFHRGTGMMNYITQLNCIADNLDKTVKNTRIAGITGGTTGAIGAAAIVTGIVLAPMTLGVSLAVTGIGVGVATAGGVTGASAAIRKKVKKTQDRKKVEKILRNYQAQMEGIEECAKFIITEMKHLRTFELSGLAVSDDEIHVVRLAEQVGNCDVIDALSENTHAIQAFVSDLDSYFTGDDAQRLKKGSESLFAAKVREVALKLKENIDQLIRIKNMFR